MALFIISSTENERLARPLVEEKLREIPRVLNLRDVSGNDPYADLRWLYAAERDVEIECALLKEGRAVEMDDDSVASCEFALAFARRWPAPLDLFDDSYSVHLQITRFRSPDELCRAMASPADS